MLANHPQASGGPFRSGVFWSILAPTEGPCGRWPRPAKCVNEPNGFPAPGAYAYVRLGLMFGRCTRCEKLDTRVVSVPASREPVPIESSDRTKGEPNSNELQIAKSN
jgi:hypothetical protein